MNVLWTPRGLEQLNIALRVHQAYYGQEARDRLEDLVETVIARLEHHPYASAPAKHPYRYVLLRVHPRHQYKLFFLIDSDTVWITHVRHSAQKPLDL